MVTKTLRNLGSLLMLQGALVLLGFVLTLFLGDLAGSRAFAAQASAGTTLRVEVELVTVEVMVLDKKGSPVRNLKKENFRLYEDGKQQEISTFDEVIDNPSQTVPTSLADIDDNGPNHGKMVLILFDDSTITPGQQKMTRDSAEKYVKEHMRPWDLFAVASYGMSLKILQNYTHDVGKVVEAIRQPTTSYATGATRLQSDSRQSGRGNVGNMGSMDASESGAPQPRSQSRSPLGGNQEAKYRAATLLRTLGSLSSSVARVKGRKTVLLYSEDFSISSDIQSEFSNAVISAQRSNVCFYTIDARGLNLSTGNQTSQIQSSPSTKAFKEMAQSGFSPLKSVFQSLVPLAEVLDAGTQTLLGSSMFQQPGGGQAPSGGGGQPSGGGSGSQPGGGTGSGSGGTGTTGTTGTTTPGNTTPGSSTPTTSNTQPSRDVTSGRSGNQMNEEGPQFEEARMENILRSLANETGGSAIFNTNNFNERLDKVDQELSNYYVLGFQSSNPKRDGKFRKLEVKTDAKGVTVKHRDGYVDPRPLDALAGSKGEKSLMNAIASPTPVSQLPITFRALYFYESPGLARIPISARIRTASIELKKKGGQLGSDLNVMGVAYAEDGSVAARFSETMRILFDKEKEEAFRRQSMSYRNYFKLRPGKYQLKLAVADEKGKVGSAEQSLVVPPMPQAGMTASSLLVAEQFTRLPDLIQNLQAKMLDDADPMVISGLQITPSVENRLPVKAPVRAIFKVYNLSGSPEQRKFVANIHLMGEKGETQAYPSVPLDQTVFQTGKTEAIIGLNLPFEQAPAGKYKLVIETSEVNSKQSVTVETDLQFL
jgi:VWFA-related protein